MYSCRSLIGFIDTLLAKLIYYFNKVYQSKRRDKIESEN